MADERTSFVKEFLEDTIDVHQSKGLLYIIPWLFVLMIGGSVYGAFHVPEAFFSQSQWDVPATVYSGVLAFNAITLALSWSAIGRILEIISHPGFSSFLNQNGMIRKYAFYVSFIHGIQVIAATMTLFALALVFIPQVPEWGQRTIMGVMFGVTLYALRWSVAAVTMTSDLIGQFARYDGLDEAARQRLRMAVNNDK